jgi:hypothetical protein
VVFQFEVVVSALRADFEPPACARLRRGKQARRYRNTGWNRVKRKTRDERSNEMGLFRKAETCSEEQSTPRHKDLKAGIWMRAVRRAIQFIAHRSRNSSASYSQVARRASSSSFSSSSSIFSRIFEDEDENENEDDLTHPYFTLRFVLKPGYSAASINEPDHTFPNGLGSCKRRAFAHETRTRAGDMGGRRAGH